MDFFKVFDELTVAIANLGDFSAYGYDAIGKLKKAMDNMIGFINRYFKTTFKIKHVSPNEVKQLGTNPFMFARGDELCYSPELIKTIKKQIIAKPEIRYNDVTYALYIVNALAHELWHNNQFKQYRDGVVSETTYFNALSSTMDYFPKLQIKYVERNYEGDAFSRGVNFMLKFCNENSLLDPVYSNNLKAQFNAKNFFTNNLHFANCIGWLNQIPFISNSNGNFVSLPSYVNQNFAGLSSANRKKLFATFPQISVGLSADGTIKNPDMLMEQFFNRRIRHEHSIFNLNTNEQNALYDIYIFLLIPNINSHIYNELCIKYGAKRMDEFMVKMKELIKRKIVLYQETQIQALKSYSKIYTKHILEGIDEAYIKKKANSGLEFLNNCLKTIDKCLGYKDKKY